MDEIRAQEKQAELLKAKNEVEAEKVSLAEKKAAIASAKKMYGRDWKKMIGGVFKSLKINQESLQSLHSLGSGGSEIRNASNPAMWRKRF